MSNLELVLWDALEAGKSSSHCNIESGTSIFDPDLSLDINDP